MAAEHDAVEVGRAVHEVAQTEPQVEAGPLPVEPAESAREGLCDPLPPVRGRRERDQRVGVKVVDVRGREESVQRRVDRGDGAAGPEPRVVEQRDHLVLVFQAAVDALHRAQAVEVDEREPAGVSVPGRRPSP